MNGRHLERPKLNLPRLLAAWLLVALPAAGAVAGAPVETASDGQAPTAAVVHKGEVALERMRQLGAEVREFHREGTRRISIRFRVPWQRFDGLQVDSGPEWQGDDADFRLVDKVAPLGEVSVSLVSGLVSPAAISKLRQPLAYLSFDYADDAWFQQIESLPPCRHISLSTTLTPANYRHLAELAPRVESLTLLGGSPDLQNLGVTDRNLAELVGLQKLQALYISDSAMTDAGLKHLAGMKSLSELSLSSCPRLENSDLAGLVECRSLRALTINSPASAAAVANIARLPALKRLFLRTARLEPAEIAPLGTLKQMKKLSIGCEVDAKERQTRRTVASVQANAMARAAAQMPALEELAIWPEVSHEATAAIAGLEQLESLNLDAVEVDDRFLAPLGRLTHLRKLNLRGMGKLTDQGLAPLAGLTKLDTLDLWADGITDAGLTHLAGLTKLVTLQLVAHGITDAGLTHLAGLTDLENLNLVGTGITGSGLPSLERAKNLRRLCLAGSQFNDDGCQRLAQFAQLKALDLSSTQITDAGMKAVSELPALRNLEIGNNDKITDGGMVLLERLKHLKSLDIWDTAVSETGAARIKAALLAVNHRDAQEETDGDGIEFLIVLGDGPYDFYPLRHRTRQAAPPVGAAGR